MTSFPIDVENFVNFFDSVFGRRHYPKSETWINGYTFEGWLNATRRTGRPLAASAPDPGGFLCLRTPPPGPTERKKSRKKSSGRMGEEPPGLPFAGVRKLPAPETPYWIHPPGIARWPAF